MAVISYSSPSEKFERIIRLLRSSASICGMDLLQANYRTNWRSYALFIFLGAYLMFVFLTIGLYFKDDWTVLLKSTVTLGSGLQGVAKIYSFISDQSIMMKLYLIQSKIFKDYEKMGERYKLALDTSLKKTVQALVVLAALYLIGFIGILLTPYLVMWIYGQRILALEFYIPGLDVDTDFGYFVTLGYQSLLLLLAGVGFCCGDFIAVVYLLQSNMFSNIFAAKVESVNEMVEDPENVEQRKVTDAIKDIIQWLQLFTEYMSLCNILFYYIITVQILTSFVSAVLCIYLIMAGGWLGAYTYVCISLGSLYVYCIIGTETQTANSKFENDIYEIHWYNLTVPQQKLILHTLCNAQSPESIDVAGVMPLSVSTALQVPSCVLRTTANTPNYA